LRLAVCKGPYRIVVSPPPHMGTEVDPVSETLYFIVFRISESKSPVILSLLYMYNIYLILNIKVLISRFKCGHSYIFLRNFNPDDEFIKNGIVAFDNRTSLG
jgi:hypothetical protein